MNGKNIVVICSLVIILSLAGYIFWSFWNNKPENAKVENSLDTTNAINEISEKPLEMKIKREDLEEALIVKLKEREAYRYFKSYELEIFKENSEWVRGLLLCYYTEQPEPPTDPHEFLARKDKDGNIIDLAYIYSEKFDEWIDIVPEEIIPSSHKPVMYSSDKYNKLYR